MSFLIWNFLIQFSKHLPPQNNLRRDQPLKEETVKKARFTAFGQQPLRWRHSKNWVKSEIASTFNYNKIYNEWWHKTLEGQSDICWPGKIKYYALSSGTSEVASNRNGSPTTYSKAQDRDDQAVIESAFLWKYPAPLKGAAAGVAEAPNCKKDRVTMPETWVVLLVKKYRSGFNPFISPVRKLQAKRLE